MLIGLHDAETESMKQKVFPNYALMKISAYHKVRGDTVEWWKWNRKAPVVYEQMTTTGKTAIDEFKHELLEYNTRFDKIYSSKVFDFTPENPYLPDGAIKGGTGYGLMEKLPLEIDTMHLDYSIYPKSDYAIGYLTRGCPNNCIWCVVPDKEGGIKPYRCWQELIRPDSNKLVLMDNNILACEFGIEQLKELTETNYRLDINQDMDARLVDKRIAGIIAGLKWIKYIRFSCDQINQVDAVINAASLLEKHGIKPYRLFIYLLVTKDIEDAAFRVEGLKELKNITIYAQAERNEVKGIKPNAAQLEFAQRYVYSGVYRKETWLEYCDKRRYRYVV